MSERSDTSNQSTVHDAMPAYREASSDAIPDDVRPGYKRAEAGVIPESWKVVSVEDIAEIRSGGTPSTHNQAFWNGDVPWCTPTDITALEGRKYLTKTDRNISSEGLRASSAEVIPPNSVIMTTRATIGECAINTVAMATNQGFKNLVPTRADPEFLYYSMASKKKQLIRLCGGSTFLEIGRKQLRQVTVALPASLEEQQAIATALSDADALIESLDRLIANKRAIKQAAMQQLLTGETRLPGFDGKWQTCRLGRVLSFQVGFPFRSQFFNSEGRGVRLVRNGDLKGDDVVLYYDGPYDSAFEISDGDILIGMDGEFVPQRWRGGTALLNQRVGRIHGSSGLDVRFAYYRLGEPLREIERTTSGTTVKHLSHGDVAGIEVPLPEIDEQSAIAQVLLDMDAELEALERRREKAGQIKEGMMQELLTGRTRLVEPHQEAAEETPA